MMFLWSFALVPHLLAIALVHVLWKTRSRSVLGWLVSVNAFLTLLIIVQLSPWIYTSLWFKYIYLLAAIAGFLHKIFIKSSIHRHKPVLWIIAAMYLGLVCTIAAHIWWPAPSASGQKLQLAYPFTKGGYYVLQGGTGLLANPFHAGVHAQKFALDIVRIDNTGMRATGIAPANNVRYHCFGDSLTSPIDGIVVSTARHFRDNQPGTMNTRFPLGNHVIIKHGEYYVIMGHLQQGEVQVSKGQRVGAGDYIGLIGNSGRSIEPHLHLQVVHYSSTTISPELLPILVNIDNRFYKINERIERPQMN